MKTFHSENTFYSVRNIVPYFFLHFSCTNPSEISGILPIHELQCSMVKDNSEVWLVLNSIFYVKKNATSERTPGVARERFPGVARSNVIKKG